MTDSRLICVTGYWQGGDCAHCGRELRHCIMTDAGTFGAACFANTLTKPLTSSRGKSYRLSTDAVISLAKMARQPERYGLRPRNLTFEAA